MRKLISGLLLVFLLIPCIALADLTVYFLDVGQGDSAIVVCDGEAMIIDGGMPRKSGKIQSVSNKIYAYIKDELHLKQLKYVIATHPDNDHIGGLPAAMQAVDSVYRVYSPVTEYDSDRFRDLENMAKNKGVKLKRPYDEETMSLGNATITFFNCDAKQNIVKRVGKGILSLFSSDEPEENEDNNNISLVVRIEYGETSFLFTGDIEKDAEARLIGNRQIQPVNVLKVAHHGSDSSSTQGFLDAVFDGVEKRYAVISCGENKKFNHPTEKTLKALKGMDVELYRTDLQGDIICTSDGKSITFKTESKAQTDVFMAPKK